MSSVYLQSFNAKVRVIMEENIPIASGSKEKPSKPLKPLNFLKYKTFFTDLSMQHNKLAASVRDAYSVNNFEGRVATFRNRWPLGRMTRLFSHSYLTQCFFSNLRSRAEV